MKLNIKFFFLIFFFPCLIHAQFTSHESITVLADYIAQEKHSPQDILIAFDLDNTLIHPITEVGSDQWLEYMAKQHANENDISVAQAYENLLPLYFKIQHLIDLQLIEEIAIDILSDLQKTGITVIGLTMRSNPILDLTLEELDRLNIKFSSLHPSKITLEGFTHNPIYNQGIIFCSSNNKGTILFEFLKRFNIKPKKIFCVDDKHHHLEKVHTAAQENGIECTCIHYTGCKERVAKYNHEQAEKELLSLNILK